MVAKRKLQRAPKLIAWDRLVFSICATLIKPSRLLKSAVIIKPDHDPLFLYHRWITNLDILGIEQIKSIPHTPISHPFIERLIGTIRREYLDHAIFVNDRDLQEKLRHFVHYYNQHRAHHALDSQTPLQKANLRKKQTISIKSYRWKSQLKRLAQLPIAA